MTTSETKETPRIVTRIFINEDGNIVVTDLWEEIETLLQPHFTLEGDES